jgi:hypothetical protein
MEQMPANKPMGASLRSVVSWSGASRRMKATVEVDECLLKYNVVKLKGFILQRQEDEHYIFETEQLLTKRPFDPGCPAYGWTQTLTSHILLHG